MNSTTEEYLSSKQEDTNEVKVRAPSSDSNNQRHKGRKDSRPRLNYSDVIESYRPKDGRLAMESQKMYEGLQSEDAEIEEARQEGDQADQTKAASQLEMDLQELTDMFSNFDPELIQDLYLSSNLDKQATTEALLKISRDGGGSDRGKQDDDAPKMTPDEYQKEFPPLVKDHGEWEAAHQYKAKQYEDDEDTYANKKICIPDKRGTESVPPNESGLPRQVLTTVSFCPEVAGTSPHDADPMGAANLS
ncbi:hypothetical protein FOL47_006466 [Perkinsus chesapeaki]|uniref:CUE domain-containing protein n=1 Tax=Perkinsus chesapeaki TaxID=330153 RepID=A0A7J6LRY4_PERCH|nr:hypothetical protein FOL47_006466 [Perkinsus chesapeaki]